MSGSAHPDLIRLAGVRATGFHGVLAEEKRVGQEFVVDVELSVDLARAGTSDDLAHTVSYAEVAADVVTRITTGSHDLIETLAEEIAADCLLRPLVERVTVTVHKPQAPVGVPFGDVAIRVVRHRPAVPVVVALGANLGDRAATIEAAVREIVADGLVEAARVSRPVETEPVGGPEQPAYLNAVLVGSTRLAPAHLLRRLHGIEARHGRVREVRWGARTLDLDLVQYGRPGDDTEVVSADPALLLPHPRAHERAFVLLPWADVDPGARLRMGPSVVSVRDRLGVVGSSGIRPAPHPDAEPGVGSGDNPRAGSGDHPGAGTGDHLEAGSGDRLRGGSGRRPGEAS